MIGDKHFYIIAEEHYTNLKFMTLYAFSSIKKDFDNKIKKINEDISKNYYKDLLRDLSEIDDYLKELESTIDFNFEVEKLKVKEYEILDNLLKNIENSVVAYLEGNKEVWNFRPEILRLLNKYDNVKKVVYLDEGNPRYERLVDEKGNFLKSVEEIQIGREDFWIKKIKENPNYDFSIAIVGKNHVIPNSKPFIGYFAQKIRELGYSVYIEML